MIELKNCPFCGGRAKIMRFNGQNGYRYFASCECCYTNMTPQGSERAAAEAWNRRVPEPEPEPLTLEELREREGTPVYLITNHSKKWVICGEYEWRQGHITEWQHFDGFGVLSCEDYMEKTNNGWVCYDRPPKEDAL